MTNRFANIQKPTMVWHWRSWEDIKSASAFTLANYMNVILLVVFVILAIQQVKSKQVST